MKWIDAQEEFEAAFPGKDHFVFQFHDTRAAMGASGSRRVFTTSHPSDYLVTSRGQMYYAEVKDSENETSFPFANIKKSQWAAATQQAAAGGNYYFFIRRNLCGTWYKVPAILLLQIRRIKQSVKWTELSDFIWDKNGLAIS